MLTTLLVSAVLLQAPAQENKPLPSAKELMAKCIARYVEAGTLRGTITMTQTAQGKSLQTLTGVQISKPLRVYVNQVRKGSEDENFLLTSDGKYFSYPPIPSQVLRMKRSVEPFYDKNGKAILNTETGKPLGLPDIYIAVNGMLLDKNVWLDMAFGQLDHMKAMRAKWATVAYRGRVKVKGQEVHAVSGEWRETGIAVPTGEYEAYITDNHDLVRYVVNERIAVPAARQTVEVSTIWDAELQVGGEVDESFFRVAR